MSFSNAKSCFASTYLGNPVDPLVMRGRSSGASTWSNRWPSHTGCGRVGLLPIVTEGRRYYETCPWMLSRCEVLLQVIFSQKSSLHGKLSTCEQDDAWENFTQKTYGPGRVGRGWGLQEDSQLFEIERVIFCSCCSRRTARGPLHRNPMGVVQVNLATAFWAR